MPCDERLVESHGEARKWQILKTLIQTRVYDSRYNKRTTLFFL